MTQPPSPIVDEAGLVDKVPTEIWLAYEDRAREIAQRARLEAAVAVKNAILRFALEARLAGSASLVSPPKAGAGEPWKPIDDKTMGPVLVCRFGDEGHNWLPMTAYRISGGKWERPASRDGLPYEPTHCMPLPVPLGATPNHEARGDGVRVTDEMVERAARAMATAIGVRHGHNPAPEENGWLNSERREEARAALEAALPPLGDDGVTAADAKQWMDNLDASKEADAKIIRSILAGSPPLGDGRAEIVEAWPGDNYELYEAVHNAAIAEYEAATPADYRYSASALRRAVDAAIRALSPNPGDRS